METVIHAVDELIFPDLYSPAVKIILLLSDGLQSCQPIVLFGTQVVVLPMDLLPSRLQLSAASRVIPVILIPDPPFQQNAFAGKKIGSFSNLQKTGDSISVLVKIVLFAADSAPVVFQIRSAGTAVAQPVS